MNYDRSCSSCSKESYKTVPLGRIFEKLDECFSKNDLYSAGRLLDYWENEARALHDLRGLLEILNEKIGYYRRTNEKEKAFAAIEEAFELIDGRGIGDRISIGTIYVNGATTMKAFGHANEAMYYYRKAEEIYHSTAISDNDYRFAALYNNWSSACKDVGDFERSEELCFKAIDILKQKDTYNGEIAVSLINIAHLYYDKSPFDERIYQLIDEAWERLMSKSNVRDGNFAFFCSKCYPSFGFFGYFEREAELKALTEKIYAGN